jgi:hypothetical protein
MGKGVMMQEGDRRGDTCNQKRKEMIINQMANTKDTCFVSQSITRKQRIKQHMPLFVIRNSAVAVQQPHSASASVRARLVHRAPAPAPPPIPIMQNEPIVDPIFFCVLGLRFKTGFGPGPAATTACAKAPPGSRSRGARMKQLELKHVAPAAGSSNAAPLPPGPPRGPLSRARPGAGS